MDIILFFPLSLVIKKMYSSTFFNIFSMVDMIIEYLETFQFIHIMCYGYVYKFFYAWLTGGHFRDIAAFIPTLLQSRGPKFFKRNDIFITRINTYYYTYIIFQCNGRNIRISIVCLRHTYKQIRDIKISRYECTKFKAIIRNEFLI